MDDAVLQHPTLDALMDNAALNTDIVEAEMIIVTKTKEIGD